MFEGMYFHLLASNAYIKIQVIYRIKFNWNLEQFVDFLCLHFHDQYLLPGSDEYQCLPIFWLELSETVNGTISTRYFLTYDAFCFPFINSNLDVILEGYYKFVRFVFFYCHHWQIIELLEALIIFLW